VFIRQALHGGKPYDIQLLEARVDLKVAKGERQRTVPPTTY